MTRDTILVVDDDPDVLVYLESMLTNQGREVVCSRSAAAALDACEAGLPGALIVDLMLPSMDGEAFILELRRRHPDQEMPVVLLSASAVREDVAERLGTLACFPKPIDFAVLSQTLNQVLPA